MIAVIHPGPAAGTVEAPPSKSMAHRAVLAAALAQGPSLLRRVSFSQDVRATLGAAREMGACVTAGRDTAEITGCGFPQTPGCPVDCCESGSTLRFLIPILSLTGQPVQFTGRGRLFQRPQTVYQNIFDAQHLPFVPSESGLSLQGPLEPGAYELPGNVSSQFISGLLLALPLLDAPSTLRIQPPFESRPYVDMTLAALDTFGVRAFWDAADKNLLHIPAPQQYQGREYTVEGDYSQAAFFAVLGALCGNLCITGLRPDSLQGDAEILNILHRCGAVFTRRGTEIRFEKSSLTATRIDLASCPDLGPILMVLALFCKGTTVIENAGRLRLKESDRIAAMQQELARFGADVQADETTVTITGAPLHQPEQLCGHNDHRVVMSLAVAALAAGYGVSITGAQAVNKSWPDFFTVLQSLGVEVECRDEP